ncbi:hypothetical protein [Roseomonas sp. 18066]|uniref:hypothetical protein n=1 Tax=Roseomonas sp. 18066 TaxID=2681412 RepID=UPI001356D4A5|nr:hypothetical protein [Roseomonas sp. 18066]
MENTPCYRCHRETARASLMQFYVRKGFAGRDKAGYVLICPDCIEEARSRPPGLQPALATAPPAAVSNRMVALLSLLGMLALTVLVVASAGRF